MTGSDPGPSGGARLRSAAGVAALFAAWALTRAWLVVAGTQPLSFYPGGPLAFDDLDVYARWVPALEIGVLPTDDMWQYPPASAFFFLIGAFGPAAADTLLWAIIGVDLILTIVFTVHRRSAGWLWVGAGLVIGPVLVSRFDVVPTLFAVLAVLAAARPVLVGAWSAVGAAMKVWPVLLMVIVPRRGIVRAGGAFVAVTAALIGLSVLLFSEVSGFLGGQGRRGLQVESVAALPFMVAQALGADVPLEYRYGSMEVAADGAGAAAALITGVALVTFAWVAWCWWRGILAQHAPADVAFAVVLFSVVVSRVFSPQYSVWMLGLGVLCLVSGRSVLRGPVVLVTVAALIAQALYPWGYGELLSGHPGFTVLQVIRICLVVTAAVIAGLRVCNPRRVPAAPARVAAGS